MNSFDWLRLGGMIARRWPQIDFSTVDIRRVDGKHFVYILPLLPEAPPIFADDEVPSEIKIEQEEITLVKWVSGDEKRRVGYGPKSNVLLVALDKQDIM